MEGKFDPAKLERLNDPQRLEAIPPAYVLKKLELEKCSVLVDIGAGTGLFSRKFLELMEEGKAYAADLLPVMIDWMKENLSSYGEKLVPLLMGEWEIPLPEGIADLALMFNLFHELDHPAESLGEAYRILRTGGRICIADWKKMDTPQGPPIHRRIDPRDIAEALSMAGFKEIRSDDSLAQHSLLWAEK